VVGKKVGFLRGHGAVIGEEIAMKKRSKHLVAGI